MGGQEQARRFNACLQITFRYSIQEHLATSCQIHRGNHEAASGSFWKHWVAVASNCQKDSLSIQYFWLIEIRMLDTSYKHPKKIKVILTANLGSGRNFFPSLCKKIQILNSDIYYYFIFFLPFFQKARCATLKSCTSHLNNVLPLLHF